MDYFQTPWAALKLQRWPAESPSELRAWDAADELLLSHLASLYTIRQINERNLLIINDAHGALSCALHSAKPVNWSDSFVAQQSARLNLDANQLDGVVHWLSSAETPRERADLVLIKIPKTIALLEDQLARLRPMLNKDVVIIAAAMTRHMPRSAFAALERFLGPVTTSLAVKKARLIFASVDYGEAEKQSPYPTEYLHEFLGISLLNHANVFSRERLDLGARFFLEQFHRLPGYDRALDLACGNGVLGLHLLKKCPAAQITFVDESYMAVASAQENVNRLVSAACYRCDFVVADGLSDQSHLSADLIVCNPPFHSQHAVVENTALVFFKQSHKVLCRGGELWFVANRHLKYRQMAKRFFGHCEQIAGNGRFTVYRSVKR